jgi:hypothetical protein
MLDFSKDVREFVENAINNRDFVDVYLMLNRLDQAYPFYRVILNDSILLWKEDIQKTMGFRSYALGNCNNVAPTWMGTYDNFKFVKVKEMHILDILDDMESSCQNHIIIKEYIKGIRDYWTKKMAARKIQRQWRECNMNPGYRMCLRRLRYEFDDMVVCEVANLHLR